MSTETPTFTFRPIGIVHSPYTTAQEVPKGLGAEHRAEGTIEIFPEFAEGLLDVEGFSHLFVLWVFDRAGWTGELVGVPPTDDRPHGVFATRSPRRPNPLGLTVVELLRREGSVLHLRGVDMLDGTPVLDLKPYLSGIPAEQLRRGWLAAAEGRAGGRTRPSRHASPSAGTPARLEATAGVRVEEPGEGCILRRMARMQVYLPDDLYELVKARGLPASELLQKAVRAELRRLELLNETDRYVADLVAEVGPPAVAQRTSAAAVARRLARRPTRQAS
jgi:tRNA-Thr(GGU) m(6)t(6)A37 methyltransferase TsaA